MGSKDHAGAGTRAVDVVRGQAAGPGVCGGRALPLRGLLPGGAGTPDMDQLSSARSGVCFLENQHKGDIHGREQKPNLYLKNNFVISAC